MYIIGQSLVPGITNLYLHKTYMTNYKVTYNIINIRKTIGNSDIYIKL